MQLQQVEDENGGPQVDTGAHGVEIPTAGTPSLAGVHEAGGPRPLGARTFSKFMNHDQAYLLLLIVK